MDRLIGPAVFIRLKHVLREFAGNWRRFLLIHLAVHVLILILLTPAASLLLSASVWLSGNVAISDEDIFFYLFSPAGFIIALILLALFSIIIFLEYAALLTAAHIERCGREARLNRVLRVLVVHFVRLFRLSVQILLRVLLNSAPFIAFILLVYWLLLSDYDINFYLSNRPAEWYLALLLGAVTGLCWAARIFYLMTVWAYCLPLILFTSVRPGRVCAESKRLSRGRRLEIVQALLAWLFISAILATAATFFAAVAADILVPVSVNSMRLLLLVMSVVSLWSYLLSFIVAYVSTALLSLLLLDIYSGNQEPELVGALQQHSPAMKWEIELGGKTVTAILALGLAVSAVMAYGLINQVRYEDSTVVVAHRGASFAAPENTRAAVEAAIDSGAEWVEIDVQETVDGEVVVIHDRDLKKVAGVPLVVAESTLEELRQMDVGSWFAKEFSDERIPTLSEILELCRGRIGVNIELKYYGDEILLEQRVVDIVERSGMVDEVVLMSLKPGAVSEIRRLRPDWRVGLLTSVAVGNLAALDVDFIAINARFASRQLVRSLHRQDKEILVWTVNDAAGMSAMATRGVDGIITDEPALAVALMRQRQELEPAERLLMQLSEIFKKPSLYRQQ